MAIFKKWFGKKEEAPPAPPSAKEEEKAKVEAPPEAAQPKTEPSRPPPPPAPPAAPASPPVASPPAPEEKSRWSLFKAGLARTRAGLKGLFTFRGKLDDAYIDQIEAKLYAADFGPEMVQDLIEGPEGIRAAWKDRRILEAEQAAPYLKERLKAILARRPTALAVSPTPPTVYLVAGVNGTGKTTSIAKLAHRIQRGGGTPILVAGDTFRAAAVEQLRIWSERLGIPIVTGKPQADPASVVFQGVERALQEGASHLIVDTAGRLHTQKNLMRELRKVRDVISRKVPGAPHESLLVLDATTGQNAIQQARAFKEDIDISGIILTKLDGTAKGGIVVTINNRMEIPVKLVGVGEKVEDLEDFDPDRFVEALFEE